MPRSNATHSSFSRKIGFIYNIDRAYQRPHFLRSLHCPCLTSSSSAKRDSASPSTQHTTSASLTLGGRSPSPTTLAPACIDVRAVQSPSRFELCHKYMLKAESKLVSGHCPAQAIAAYYRQFCLLALDRTSKGKQAAFATYQNKATNFHFSLSSMPTEMRTAFVSHRLHFPTPAA